jgi:hypothetical protein
MDSAETPAGSGRMNPEHENSALTHDTAEIERFLRGGRP